MKRTQTKLLPFYPRCSRGKHYVGGGFRVSLLCWARHTPRHRYGPRKPFPYKFRMWAAMKKDKPKNKPGKRRK